MISVIILRQTFLKSRGRIGRFYGRTIINKSISNWQKPNFMELDCEKGCQIMKNSKFRPQGFDVVYVCPLLRWLNFLGPTTIAFWAILGADLYFFISQDDYIKGFAEFFGDVTPSEKIFFSVYFSCFVLFLNISVPRIPVAIFRKGNDFKTLLYGHFGPLTTKYVTHGMREVQPTANSGFYTLKGKKVFILSNGFRSLRDFEQVVKVT